MTEGPDVTVYSRANCPLCDEAIEMIDQLAPEASVRVVDIAQSPDLEAAHGERIPVVLIDGRERFWGRISRPLLARALRKAAT